MRGVHNLFRLLIIMGSMMLPSLVLAAQPSWVTGDSAEYPGSQYLVGRGVGSTQEEAQTRARGDLATVFEVHVEVVTQNSTTVAQSGNKEQVDRLSSQQVSAKTDKVISGITIGKVWRDPVTQDFYVLAVLSRSQAGASLREELAKIDDEVKQQFDVAQAAKDPLLKIGALTHALETSVKRDGFQASLKVVDTSGRGKEAPIPQATIQAQINETLKRVHVSPEVAEDGGAREFAGILKGGLAAAGFLASSSSDAEFVLVGKLTLTDLGRQANWNWMRGTVEVSLVEKSSGRVRGNKTWPVKASAQDARTAKTRTLIEIEKLLKEELRAAIIEFAGS
jgi:LPP20 lipoprotein